MFIIFGIIQIAIIVIFIAYLLKRNTKSVLIFSNTIIFATTLAILKYLLINHFYNPGYPNSTFLYNPLDRFNDFINMVETCKILDPYNFNNFLPSVYFPVSNIFFYGFYKIANDNMATSMLFFTIIFLIIFFVLLKKMIRVDNKNKILLYISLFISYPVIFSIDRMNLEMYLFLFTLGFIFFYLKEQYFIAVIFLSFAICMKLYPILFLILFLQKKNYKAIKNTIISCILLTVGSLAILKGGIITNINLLLANLNHFNNMYSGSSGLQHNASIYGDLKIIMISLCKYVLKYGNEESNNFTNLFLKYPYLIFVAFYFLTISSYILFVEKTFWKKVYLIISMTILLPHVSFDYKLLTIIIAIILFIANSNKESNAKFYSILFAVLMIPNSYFYFANDISIGVVINPIVMLLITYKILTENKEQIRNKISMLRNSNTNIFISNKIH
jgi:hypothetical protein